MPEKEVYLERRKYTEILDRNLSAFKSGAGKNIAILGHRKSGKSSIVKRHIEKAHEGISAVYIDFSRIGMSPENFAVEFIGSACHWLLGKTEHKSLDIGHVLNLVSEMNSARSAEIAKSVQNEISKIKPDQRLLVQLAFNFLNALSHDRNIKILAVLDNFEEILDINNFSQIKDVLSLVNLNHASVKYVVTSSAVSEIKKLLKNFDILEIGKWEKSEIAELVKKHAGKADPKFADAIFDLTQGNSFAAAEILGNCSNANDAKKAFAKSLLSRNGLLYGYCLDSMGYYLNRTRGQVMSKIILKAIAANRELRLSEIARKIYKSAPVTKSLIERLISADIIYRKDGKFYFHDPVLRLWLKMTSLGYEYDRTITEEDFKEVLEHL